MYFVLAAYALISILRRAGTRTVLFSLSIYYSPLSACLHTDQNQITLCRRTSVACMSVSSAHMSTELSKRLHEQVGRNVRKFFFSAGIHTR